MKPTKIKAVAHLLAGTDAGWQSRFAALLGISRGYAHNLLTGERPVTQQLIVKMIEAARTQAPALRARADELDNILEMVMPGPGEPLPISREEYDRQADEAEAIINSMVGGVSTDHDNS